MALETAAYRHLRVAKQSGTTDTPGTLLSVENAGEAIYPTCKQVKIPVETQRTDGESAMAVLGEKAGGFPFTSFLRGGGTAAGAAQQCLNAGELDPFLDCLFSGTPIHSTGKATTTGNSTTVLKFASGADTAFPVGSALCIDSDGTSGLRYEMREVVTATATDITLDRPLQGAPADAAVAFGCSSFCVNPTDHEHEHLFASLEGDSWRRDAFGCGLVLKIAIADKGLALGSWDVMANDWSDVAEANPTYAAQYDTGAIQLCWPGSIFWYGDAKTELISGNLEIGLVPVPRVATEGVNGQNGCIYTYAGAKFSGKMYAVAGSEALVTGLQGLNSYDLAMQIGNPLATTTNGNAIYWRIPAFEDNGEAHYEQMSGVETVVFSGRALRPAAGTGSLRFHVAGYNAA